MDIKEADEILSEAIDTAYPYWSSVGFEKDHDKALEAKNYLLNLAKKSEYKDKIKSNNVMQGIKEVVRKPKCYVAKIPYCVDCGEDIELIKTNFNLLSSPLQLGYKCGICGREYYIREDQLGGHWEWEK